MSVADAEGRGLAHLRNALAAGQTDTGRLILLLIIGGSAIRVVLAASVGLGIDESYMVGISRQIAWSYFDHPPIHVWLVGFWAKFFGEDPLAVRLPFIALFAGSTWLMYRLASLVYSERAGFWAAIAFNLAPVFTLSTASWVLPDGPMVFFLLLAGVCAVRVLFPDTNDARARPDALQSPWLLWLAAGGAGGLALLSKYLAIFFFAGIGLFLLTSPRHRYWLARPESWTGLALGALLFAPVLLWNIGNGFASFAFQGQRGLPVHFNVTWFIQGIGGQTLYLLPWIALAIAFVVLRGALSGTDRDRFFVWLSAPIIILFLVLPFTTRILPHWPVAGWVFAFPLLGEALAQLERSRARLLRWTAAGTAAFILCFFGITASQANYAWMGRIASMPKDPTLDLYDWRALDGDLRARGLLTEGTFVAAGYWIPAGKINYALGGRVPVLCLCDEPHHFAFLHDQSHYYGADAILLSRSPDRLAVLGRRFERVEPLPDIVLMRAGRAAITLKAARGVRLKSPP